MRKLNRTQKSRIIIDMKIADDERLIMKKAYEEQRDSYKSSPEGQFEQKVRFATQNASKSEMAAYQSIVKATVDLKEETIELIKQYLEEHSNGQEIKDLRGQDIKECLKKCDLAVAKLKNMCDNHIYKENKTYGIYSEYEKMFNYLIDKVNIRFAFFAPELSLRRKSIKYSKMTTGERYVMYGLLKQMGITDMEGFEESYGDIFKANTKENGLNF